MSPYCCSGITVACDTDIENAKTFSFFVSVSQFLFQFSIFASQFHSTLPEKKGNRFRWNTQKDESTNEIWFSLFFLCLVLFHFGCCSLLTEAFHPNAVQTQFFFRYIQLFCAYILYVAFSVRCSQLYTVRLQTNTRRTKNVIKWL